MASNPDVAFLIAEALLASRGTTLAPLLAFGRSCRVAHAVVGHILHNADGSLRDALLAAAARSFLESGPQTSESRNTALDIRGAVVANPAIALAPMYAAHQHDADPLLLRDRFAPGYTEPVRGERPMLEIAGRSKAIRGRSGRDILELCLQMNAMYERAYKGSHKFNPGTWIVVGNFANPSRNTISDRYGFLGLVLSAIPPGENVDPRMVTVLRNAFRVAESKWRKHGDLKAMWSLSTQRPELVCTDIMSAARALLATHWYCPAARRVMLVAKSLKGGSYTSYCYLHAALRRTVMSALNVDEETVSLACDIITETKRFTTRAQKRKRRRDHELSTRCTLTDYVEASLVTEESAPKIVDMLVSKGIEANLDTIPDNASRSFHAHLVPNLPSRHLEKASAARVACMELEDMEAVLWHSALDVWDVHRALCERMASAATAEERQDIVLRHELVERIRGTPEGRALRNLEVYGSEEPPAKRMRPA